MKILKVKKNGKLVIEETIGTKVTVKKANSLKEYLACEVEFDKGLTFGTFFKLVLKDKDFFDIIFSEELNGRKLIDFESKMDAPPGVYNDEFSFDYLELSKIFELYSFQGGNTINLFCVFVGIGKTIDGFDIYAPLSSYTVSEIKNLEISINKLVEIYKELQMDEDDDVHDTDVPNMNDDYDDDEEEGGDDIAVPFIEAYTRITLYDIIQSIIYELAFYKNDEDRVEVRKSQNNDKMTESKILILQTQMKWHVDNDEYERAAEIKREIDRLKVLQVPNKE